MQVQHAQRYEYNEFIDRVIARLNYDDIELDISYGQPATVDRSEAVFRVKAVIALLGEIVPGGEIARVEQKLPDEFESLFEFVDIETAPWEQN